MPSWTSIFVLILTAAFVLAFPVQLFPNRFFGKRIFKRQLRRHGVDSRILPDACIQEFVEDALKYATVVSSVPRSPETSKAYFILEFERMLRIHAFVAAALLRGKKGPEIWELEGQQIAETIAAALLRGQKGGALWKLGARKVRQSITQEAIEAAMLRKRVGILDMEAQWAVQADVKSGKEWEAQETILKKHGVLQ